VVNGQVSSVVTIATNQAVAPELWFDINGLFTTIEIELILRPSMLEATFDSATGFPTHVKYGDLAVDAGADVVITNFLRA